MGFINSFCLFWRAYWDTNSLTKACIVSVLRIGAGGQRHHPHGDRHPGHARRRPRASQEEGHADVPQRVPHNIKVFGYVRQEAGRKRRSVVVEEDKG